jgi:hypothetical protein
VTITRKEFDRLKARLRDAVLHDQRLTRAERHIGYEIADNLNFRSGDAWPSQDYLARRTGYSTKSIERATKRLAGTVECHGLWFTREIDGRAYRYVPRFDQLHKPREQPNTRQNVGYQRPSFATGTPDICDRNTRQDVGLSSLKYPSREPLRQDCGQLGVPPPSPSNEKTVDRSKDVIAFTHQDEAFTVVASDNGAPRFVFEGSEPWRAWLEYRERIGIPGSLPTRQHMVNGRWRTGWDVPTLYPPGYGRVKSRHKA